MLAFMAKRTIAVVPVMAVVSIVVFLLAQRYYVNGISVSGINK